MIGVDAGGTRLRAYLADGTGRVLGSGTGGPGNALSVGRADLTRHLAHALDAAVPADLRGLVVAAAGGFAGAAEDAGPGWGRRLAALCLAEALALTGMPGVASVVYGDVDVAFASAPGAPADGLVLVAGTGAAAGRVVDRRCVRTSDGGGWLLGDSGSGFWLGHMALRAVLRALDERGPWTSLADTVPAHCVPGHMSPRAPWPERGRLKEQLVGWAHSGPPVALALLSPLVVTAAEAGDGVARSLLDEAAAELAATVAALAPRRGEPLVVTGGLVGPEGPLLDRLTERTRGTGLRITAVRDGGAGAVALARLLI
ncbi:BadF/BadG/BcrA/BcrD ATPase family protein [Streptomyces sp. NPDC006923]|uniref:N-acetylglucosamine kinase n=1 Tax=Streptomyces sp. NPDC006923 TaxID=3155355 RepID=UPI0033EDE2FE